MGHIRLQKTKDGPKQYFTWEGELSPKGKLVRDEVGPPNPTGLLPKKRPW